MLREQARARAGTRQPRTSVSGWPSRSSSPATAPRLLRLHLGRLDQVNGRSSPPEHFSQVSRPRYSRRPCCLRRCSRAVLRLRHDRQARVRARPLVDQVSHLSSSPLLLCRQSSPRLRTDVGGASFQRGQCPRAPLMRTHTSLVGCAVEGGHAHATSSCCVLECTCNRGGVLY